MNQEIWTALIGGGVVSFVLTFLITWGSLKASSQDAERRLGLTEKELKAQLSLIHGLRDVYVSYQHFNEIMNTIRDTQRELKADMQKIIELLTERA